MVSIFEENDAGYAHIIALKGKIAYDAHNELLQKQVSTITDYDDCQLAMENWMKFFRKDHFRFTKTDSVIQKQVSAKIWPEQFATEQQDVSEISGQSENTKNTIIGTWKNNDHHISVMHQKGQYIGSVLRDTLSWRKGQIVFRIDEDLKIGTRFQSSFRPLVINKFNLLGSNLLQIDGFIYQRDIPAIEIAEIDKEYYHLKNSRQTYAYKRNDSTLFLRIPSFSFNKTAIDSVLKAFDQTIRATPNLIIDLRDCMGGQDNNFTNLLPYLYSGTTRTVALEILSTKKNNLMWDEFLKNPDLDEEDKTTYKVMQQMLNNRLGEFVNVFGENVFEFTPDTIYSYPKNVGIIIHENNFSTTEQFILSAKQSKKVKFFGRKTGGALDVSNMVDIPLSTGDFIFEYCISRSLRIPEMAVDDMGIHPDFYLDKSIGENHWIDFVSNTIAQWN